MKMLSTFKSAIANMAVAHALEGDIDPTDPTAVVVRDMLPTSSPSGVKVGVPFVVVEDLIAGTAVSGIQNPSDSDCIVIAIVNVTTLDSGITRDVGIDSAGTSTADTLIDGGSVAAGATIASFDDDDAGTNGQACKLIDKKGGTNDYVVFTNSSGADTVAGTIILVFFPLGA